MLNSNVLVSLDFFKWLTVNGYWRGEEAAFYEILLKIKEKWINYFFSFNLFAKNFMNGNLSKK